MGNGTGKGKGKGKGKGTDNKVWKFSRNFNLASCGMVLHRWVSCKLQLSYSRMA